MGPTDCLIDGDYMDSCGPNRLGNRRGLAVCWVSPSLLQSILVWGMSFMIFSVCASSNVGILLSVLSSCYWQRQDEHRVRKNRAVRC